MNTVSKITYSYRDVLESQRNSLVEQLKELQFKLFDKSAPEVVEHLNQLQIEKAKQVIAKPSKSKKVKFTQTKDQGIELNEALIEKHRNYWELKDTIPTWTHRWPMTKL